MNSFYQERHYVFDEDIQQVGFQFEQESGFNKLEVSSSLCDGTPHLSPDEGDSHEIPFYSQVRQKSTAKFEDIQNLVLQVSDVPEEVVDPSQLITQYHSPELSNSAESETASEGAMNRVI